MIHLVNDFYNKAAKDIRDRFFENAVLPQDNPDYQKTSYSIELFNNGCLTYRAFIGRLAKSCKSNNATIHNIIEKHVVSFGAYQYKPGRIYSQNKVANP